EELRNQYLTKLEAWRANEANRHELEGIVEELRGGEKPVPPMHWEIEFPEVFGRENPGFDAMVGNPPFMRGHDISKKIGVSYREIIALAATDMRTGIADYVAYFFPRATGLIRRRGSFGFVATNSIADGDSQKLALESLAKTWCVYSARTDIPWPGSAGIVVSVIHLFNDEYGGERTLNGEEVPLLTRDLRTKITATPKRLAANAGICFVGSYPLGDGYIVSAETARHWIKSDASYRQVLFPYINGIETNSVVRFDPDASRWVISFWNWSEEEAMRFPSAYEHLKGTVLSLRRRQKEKHRRERWWQHARPTPGLYCAIGRGDLFAPPKLSQSRLERVLLKSKSSNTWEFAFLSNDMLFDQSLAVFAVADSGRFTVLQSTIHELWAWERGSKLKVDLSYTPSTVFQTFPMPPNPEALSSIGDNYLRARTTLQQEQRLSLTEFANSMTNPDDRSDEIEELRAIRDDLDAAVIRSYGWSDIVEQLNLDWRSNCSPAPPKSYIYRWPVSTRVAVLARLLDLNQKRYAEEVAAGLHNEKGEKKAPKKVKPKMSPGPDATLLLLAEPVKPSKEK
ncbi:MAG: hypothetical protein O7H41_19525, partial [Planctomycetota bacterium]|nr:hypothetical protein [Planctomycetota bacterium]